MENNQIYVCAWCGSKDIKVDVRINPNGLDTIELGGLVDDFVGSLCLCCNCEMMRTCITEREFEHRSVKDHVVASQINGEE